MTRIELHTRIDAPVERVFDIARCVEAHVATQTRHRERAVAGTTSGLMELGDEVTWEAVHFGVRQRLTSRITRMERPASFRDSQARGAFAGFDHDHVFEAVDGGTRMTDVFVYGCPLGPLGRLADHLAVRRHMTRLLADRAEDIKRICESGEWRRFL